MKIVFTILFFSLISLVAKAQTEDKDGSHNPNKTELDVSPQTDEDSIDKDKKGVGDLLLTLGEGFLDRLKYRFNLGGLENKIENATRRFDNKDEDQSTTAPETAPK